MKENAYLKLKDYCINFNEQFNEVKIKEDECFAILQEIAIEYAKTHPSFDSKFKIKLLEQKAYYDRKIKNDKEIEKRIIEDEDINMLNHKIRVDFVYIESILPSLDRRIQAYSKIKSVEEVGEDKFISYFVTITNLRYYSHATAGSYLKCLKTVEDVYNKDKGFLKKFLRKRKEKVENERKNEIER